MYALRSLPVQATDFAPSKMRRALLAVGSETGHAFKSSASRIRRRSRQRLAEASELGGPMTDRLRRWLTPVVIDPEFKAAGTTFTPVERYKAAIPA